MCLVSACYYYPVFFLMLLHYCWSAQRVWPALVWQNETYKITDSWKMCWFFHQASCIAVCSWKQMHLGHLNALLLVQLSFTFWSIYFVLFGQILPYVFHAVSMGCGCFAHAVHWLGRLEIWLIYEKFYKVSLLNIHIIFNYTWNFLRWNWLMPPSDFITNDIMAKYDANLYGLWI